jgi:hypothetical protein
MIAVEPDPGRVFLALDPGKTTGVAWLTPGNGFGFMEVAGRFNLYVQLREWASTGMVPEIVIEDWQVRADTAKLSSQVDPHRIIGWVEGWAYWNGYPFSLQTPGQAKSFGTDSKLRAVGWEATTKGGHARDAARHLLTYLVRRYPGQGQIGGELKRKIMESL